MTRQSSIYRRVLRHLPARVGAGLLLLALVAALVPQWLAPYGVNEADAEAIARPSAKHWLGTDMLGKDVLSRVCYGARLSLTCGGLSMALAVVVGLPLGATAGYFSGATDAVIMRTMDIALSFPAVLIALLVAVALPPGWARVVIAVALINLPAVARQCRATVLTTRNLDFVLASRALGASSFRTLYREILPFLSVPVVTLATLGMGTAILEVAALSFLGLGGDPTDAEWGTMLAQSRHFWSQNPWAAAGPGLAISLTVLGCNLLGDALRDALDRAS